MYTEIYIHRHLKIDEKDKAVRKRWFQYSLFYFIGYPFLTFLMVIIASFFFPSNTNAWKQEILPYGLAIIRNLIFFGITYYFAYKKYGTKWLTFCLILISIEIIAFVAWIAGILNISFSPLEKGSLVLELPLSIGWFILTWQLRKTNRRMQLSKQFSQDSKACIDILEQTASLEDLNSKFYNLLQTQPQLEPILSDVYKNKKKLLKGSPQNLDIKAL